MKTFTLLFAFLISFTLVAQNVNIPDSNFKNALLSDATINTNSDNEIQVSEAQAFTGTIQVSNKNISDLTGIEFFDNLTKLYCHYNNLTTINLKDNKELLELGASNNKINFIEVDKNVKLQVLGLGDNELTNINIDENVNLIELYLNANKLNTIDVSKNTALGKLLIGGNNLTSLNVLQNTNLRTLSCAENSISDLDISNCLLLEDLNCGYNNLSTLNTANNISLFEISCDDNSLTFLDVTKNVNLLQLFCRNNKITELDLTKNTKLGQVFLQNNLIKILDISNAPDMTEFYCNDNSLTGLDVANGNNANLYLNASQNPGLQCINVDVGFSPTNWDKDPASMYGTNCAVASIDDVELGKHIKIYPNPFKNNITIDNFSNENVALSIIYTSLGKSIKSSSENILNTKDLSKGVYFLKIRFSSGKHIIKKIVK
ncbi:T9SS type A sorting domain-containing protein [Polaribacter porphyrae]|uniref:Secretion system C-terminal sorting domain-containing protein n=1 Tax=Polaribacter porphyrae TaxID=1137780 RepID=A0A2S7WM32_9FLAO|nr:T9SS type A sorting domain-containing protein [Polaribacter porphyrae]PQJ78372.1 hypothetical protein BTO18_03825 [Polaribacter porphyrae]